MVEGKINKIHGWAAMKPGIKVEEWTYTPRPLGDHDVEIKIEYSGICGSDLHTIKEEWGGTSYPAIVGHEIVGKIITVGDQVTEFKEGDLVGVGAQVYACQRKDCGACMHDLDPHCPRSVLTYNSKYADGEQAQGGYAEAVRVIDRYVFKIPPGLASDPALLPPLFCAGVTVYAPMLRRGVKKGDRVGIIGIGGLGHLAIQYATAMGAEVVAFSHTPNKREQCLKLGAKKFVLTSDEEQLKAERRALNYLLVTSNAKSNQYNEFISWMDFGGTVIILALPEGHMTFSPFELVMSEVAVTGSLIGGVNMIRRALDLAEQHNIRPIIEKYPIDKVNEALQHMDAGKARYRIVLTH